MTLVERDALTDSVVTRKGVPQGRRLHVLLPRGAGIVERLFPGYARELTAAGAVSLRVPTDALVLTPAGWLDRRAIGWPLLSASRPLFEWAVRRRRRELPGVRILDRHDVTSLVTSHDGRQIAGVCAHLVLHDYRWHYLARIWRTPVLGEARKPSRRPKSSSSMTAAIGR